MWPSFSLCAWRILKIKSCFRNPLAPGRSKDRAILVNSVMFFSLSSAMVIGHLRGDFQGGYAKEDLPSGARGGAGIKQPAVVPRQNVPARQELTAPPSLPSGPGLRSWFPGFWCLVCETYG